MKTLFRLVVVTIALGLVLPLRANDKPAPVRMGCGIMTFDTVPGWGLGLLEPPPGGVTWSRKRPMSSR